MLASRITQSVAYPSTAATGTTVLDAEPNSNAARKSATLPLRCWKYSIELMRV